MPTTAQSRKLAPRTIRRSYMIDACLTQAEVAAACGVEESLVSHVVAGRRGAKGERSQQVMAYIANELTRRLGSPVTVAELWPIAS